MESDDLFARYQELQQYVGWNDEDAQRVKALASLVEPHFAALIDDFYLEIERHPNALKVITGGKAQIERLKGTLTNWLHELFVGRYDEQYVARRWRVGGRHVEIGLSQVYTNAALSRLRSGLLRVIEQDWPADQADAMAVRRSLNKLLDLDLAIIEDAYQSEFQRRQQRSERLATIGQVAGGVAHELRNPLNVVKTSVYYLLNADNPPPEKQTAHLQRIERQVGVADAVITALNNFARLPVPELKAVALEQFLREVLDVELLPDALAITIDCPADLPTVQGDPDQLQIVFGNVFRNARDAMPNGGALAITARANGGTVEISVQDSGVGIPKQDLNRIMEPLYSTKSRGIGLGLPITRAIVEKHNGTIEVSSEVGRGTLFRVTLPASAND